MSSRRYAPRPPAPTPDPRVELFRVYPHLDTASERSEPGHPLFADRALQEFGRFDNPDLYAALYVASTAAGAIGETFQSIRTWTANMLPHPMLPGSRRRLATFLFDEERHQLLDLDDAQTLVEYRRQSAALLSSAGTARRQTKLVSASVTSREGVRRPPVMALSCHVAHSSSARYSTRWARAIARRGPRARPGNSGAATSRAR
jgi:hypothetical protein